MSEAVFEFTDSGFAPVPEEEVSAYRTLVSDSWLVTDGRTVAWDHHVHRFFASVLSETKVDQETLRAFIAEVHARTPHTGRWFPRVEVVSHSEGERLRYRHRSAPRAEATAILARAPHDPRTRPLVKGPDLTKLLALRGAVAPNGATEAIIVDAKDRIIEGAYSTVLVWPADTAELVVITPSIPRLPSVTEAVLLNIARDQGVKIREDLLSVSDLENAEVWVVSALHGIRLATAFVDGPALNSTPERSAQWQEWWHRCAQPPGLA